jgi:DNA-binding GntR family transcriptional regulator
MPARARVTKAWEALQRFRDLPDSYDLVAARNRFYRTITEASGNPELRRIVPSIRVHLIRRDYPLSALARIAALARPRLAKEPRA